MNRYLYTVSQNVTCRTVIIAESKGEALRIGLELNAEDMAEEITELPETEQCIRLDDEHVDLPVVRQTEQGYELI